MKPFKNFITYMFSIWQTAVDTVSTLLLKIKTFINFRTSKNLIIRIFPKVKTFINFHSIRIIIYVLSILIFFYVLLSEKTKKLFFNPSTVSDIERLYAEKRYDEIVYYAPKIKVSNESVAPTGVSVATISEQDLLSFYVAKSYIKLFKETENTALLYKSVDNALKIKDLKLSYGLLRAIAHLQQANDDKRVSLLYYYLRNKKVITKNELQFIIPLIKNSTDYLGLVNTLAASLKKRDYRVFYKLAKIYYMDSQFDKAIKFSYIAKALLHSKRFKANLNNFILRLQLLQGNCPAVLHYLNRFKLSRRFTMYKFYCEISLNIVDVNKLKKFLELNTDYIFPNDLLTMKHYLTIKILLFEKKYDEIFQFLKQILNTDYKVVGITDTAAGPAAIVTKDYIVSELLKKLNPFSTSKKNVRSLLALVLKNNNKLNPLFFLSAVENYIFPNSKVLFPRQKLLFYNEIIRYLQINKDKFNENLTSLLNMHYVLTKSYFHIKDYENVVSYANQYNKINLVNDSKRAQIYKLLINALYMLKDYKSVIDKSNEAIKHYSNIYVVRFTFEKSRLNALKKIDKNSYVKEVIQFMKTPTVNFSNDFFKFFFKEYLDILLDKTVKSSFTKNSLIWLEKLIMYKTIYEEFYGDRLHYLDYEIIKFVSSITKLNNCSRLISYYNNFSKTAVGPIDYIQFIFENDLSESLYKFSYCMLKRKKPKLVVSLMKNAIFIKTLSNLDKFMVSAFLYLGYKNSEQNEKLASSWLQMGEKIYSKLDLSSLNKFSSLPYNPRKIKTLLTRQSVRPNGK